MFHVPERYRLKGKVIPGLSAPDGDNGVFLVPLLNKHPRSCLQIIASDGAGWEHVSVCVRAGKKSYRVPTWAEMVKVKDIFWDEEDCVVQYFPPKSEWINNHNYVLHLWRPVGQAIPAPPSMLVGYASFGTLVR